MKRWDEELLERQVVSYLNSKSILRHYSRIRVEAEAIGVVALNDWGMVIIEFVRGLDE